MKSKFHCYEAADGWRWRLVTSNGRVVADSGEAYTRKAAVARAVSNLAALAQFAGPVEWLDSAPPIARTRPPPPSAAADRKAREKHYG